MSKLYELTCWYCSKLFKHEAPEQSYDGTPRTTKFYQGSTVCKNCVQYMPGYGVPVYDEVAA